tara:strand:- start:6 stop:338 length:333 start_codon:yes stop_codon:yes gene_type:complete
MESKSNLDKIVDTEKLMANQARYEKDAKDLLTVFEGQVNMLYNQAEEAEDSKERDKIISELNDLRNRTRRNDPKGVGFKDWQKSVDEIFSKAGMPVKKYGGGSVRMTRNY